MDEDFAKWVQRNLKFEKITKKMVNMGHFDEDLVGGRTLTCNSLRLFDIKKLEYQNRLEEATGYTYDFTGGLMWEW